jgi:hypothetical protein
VSYLRDTTLAGFAIVIAVTVLAGLVRRVDFAATSTGGAAMLIFDDAEPTTVVKPGIIFRRLDHAAK